MKTKKISLTKSQAAVAGGCPAAALAQRAERLLQVREVYEDRRAMLDDVLLSEVCDGLEAIERSISVCQSASLEGAVFQLVQAGNLVGEMMELDLDERVESDVRAVLRMLWSQSASFSPPRLAPRQARQ